MNDRYRRISVDEAETAQRERAGTNAAFNVPAKTCKELIADLDPVVKMKYRDNPPKLAEWLVAAHIERAPRRAGSNAAKKPPTE